MDPFTQRMLEKAEQRSRALGISSAGRFPLSECSSDANASSGVASQEKCETQQQQQQSQLLPLRSPASAHASTNTTNSSISSAGSGGSNKLQVVEKTPLDASSMTCNTPNKVLRQFSAVDKENMEMGIEINIMTDKDVEVQVQVEEQEITDEGERGRETTSQPLAKIRDTSRNRLQRLGALYSNPNDLSSPIHRTEGQFHAEETELDGSPKRPKQRYGKLAALANSINQWEDDTAHHHQQVPSGVPPPKPDLPSRVSKKAPAPAPPTSPKVNTQATVKQTTATPVKHVERGGGDADCLMGKTKQLKWDPKVINSLEAQGFQRRESSTVRLAYEYDKDAEGAEEAPKESGEKPKVTKLLTPFTIPSSSAKANTEEKKPKVSSVKPGLVSGRAAAFESKASAASQPTQRPQKDPTELSLKERMQLFERNKGEALVPKAAFGMAPSINQIRQDNGARKEEATKAATSNAVTAPTVATVKPGTESKLRDKVAALVANATTISENKIKAEIHKQRQEDMQILANRFHKQKEPSTKDDEQTQAQASVKPTVAAPRPIGGAAKCPPPPPPPPPMPAASSKRRSPGDSIEDDESKRARKSAIAMNRLYPALSDLESNESLSDNDHCGTTATMSGRSTADEQQKLLSAKEVTKATDADADDDENDSYMESEEADDSSVGICNGSLGREIMQVVQKKDNQQRQTHKQPHAEQSSSQQQQVKQMKEVHYADRDYYYGGAAGCDSSMNSSEASMGVDDYLDEALDDNVDDGDDDCTQESEEDENTSRASRGSKGTTASNSFSFRKTPKKYTNCQTISEESDDFQTPHTTTSTATTCTPPVRSELSVNQEDENMVTLVHTVSFYRRQQNSNSASSTPVRKICREQQVPRSEVESATCAMLKIDVPPKRPPPEIFISTEECADGEDDQQDIDNDDAQNLVQEKIKKLLDEVCKQQTVIAQTSQALNLCAATIEFSGSTESVEGERHLLVATHRRQACLDEVQRLRVEKSLRPLGAPREKGCVTVKEITVPLRQDYIRKLAADTISGHHLVCLLKYNEHVLATKTVPTLPGLLAVKFPDVLQMNHVYADFRITLEIYGMTAQREVLPHEVKYHINLNKKSGIRTPKKKGSDNRLVMPPVQSPAGPNVVRTPALVQYGFAIFSLREMQRTSWTLTQVLGVSPLEGVVHMKVNCELSVSVEHRGFLTMFEDISGFGAWHRRWCQLNGTVLNYWKYPDDEKKKTPMGSIDLYSCITQKVTLAPRDICARLNTMLLECQRPAREGDEESLIIVPNGRTTIVRYLLSADTKEERDQWCAYFNKTLTLLRAWGPPQ